MASVPILARPEGRAQRSYGHRAPRGASVPILARPEGRAQRLCFGWSRRDIRVPILARPEGRAQRGAGPSSTPILSCSNPRPTRRPGATLASTSHRNDENEFQSSPDPKAGRNEREEQAQWEREVFQSSPDPKAGRNKLVADPGQWSSQVPILARPEGRAQRFNAQRSNFPSGFQSSPDPKAGRNGVRRGALRLPARVPILARPEGRAQPGWRVKQRLPARVPILARPEGRAQPPRTVAPPLRSGFQSSPDPKAGRNLALRAVDDGTAEEFQSSPDPKAGRNRYRAEFLGVGECSNPRPTRRPGATGKAPRQTREPSSSNPRPTRRPGATGELACVDQGPDVPILARPEGRAQRRNYLLHCQYPPSSNPRPTRRPGATASV